MSVPSPTSTDSNKAEEEAAAAVVADPATPPDNTVTPLENSVTPPENSDTVADEEADNGELGFFVGGPFVN